MEEHRAQKSLCLILDKNNKSYKKNLTKLLIPRYFCCCEIGPFCEGGSPLSLLVTEFLPAPPPTVAGSSLLLLLFHIICCLGQLSSPLQATSCVLFIRLWSFEGGEACHIIIGDCLTAKKTLCKLWRNPKTNFVSTLNLGTSVAGTRKWSQASCNTLWL